ncbi:unnamed protein product [Meloidogyne enterolobii]|uniref:Uncharacterized protein n=1 Tax=Meloidogyne enterolobii TaxID=390850 RepID=A0ACB0YGA3_MELEN
MPYAQFVRRLSRSRSEGGARKLLRKTVFQRGSGIGGVFAALLTPILIEIGKKIIKGDSLTE